MLKLIIADDEFTIRDGLKSIVPWEEFGIELISQAIDGEEAFELCQALQPDILLTDIRMPIMDGLELAAKLKEQNSKIRIIFISGIQDFQYAKTAIDMNADGYILKPVKLNELKDVVSKVADSINDERNKAKEYEKLKQQFIESYSIIREKFLNNLINGAYFNVQEIAEKFEYFKIPFKYNEQLIVSVLQIDNYGSIIKNNTEESNQLLSFSVLNIGEKIINRYKAGICFCINENEFILIFGEDYIADNKYEKICEEIIININISLNLSICIGVGTPVNDILLISTSYKDALTALQYKFYNGINSVININDMQMPKDNLEYAELYEIQNQIMDFIKLGNSDEVTRNTEKIFANFCFSKNLPLDYVQSICAELICIASRMLHELEESIDNIIDKRLNILEKIYTTEDIFAVCEYTLSVLLIMASHFEKKLSRKNDKVIVRIKEIIEKSYMANLSVMDISQKIYLSPNYISLIFKQGTGETVTEYLTKIRMESAKELLRTTDFKIFEVAEMVGYDNPRYFSTVFKKYTSLHPQKYRIYASKPTED